MKKFAIILVILFSLSGAQKVFATGIHFVENKNWKQLLALAKQQHKLIFLDGYATWCGPCKYLQQNVFTQQPVGLYFNKTFINAKMDMEAGEGPAIAEKFNVTAYPTLFFINGDGKLVHKAVGALEAKELIALAHDALNPKKQYYSLKERAQTGKLIPADFLAWVKQAEQMEDVDAPEIVKNYLALPVNQLLQKDMLDIALNHASKLTDEQLTDCSKTANW